MQITSLNCWKPPENIWPRAAEQRGLADFWPCAHHNELSFAISDNLDNLMPQILSFPVRRFLASSVRVPKCIDCTHRVNGGRHKLMLQRPISSQCCGHFNAKAVGLPSRTRECGGGSVCVRAAFMVAATTMLFLPSQVASYRPRSFLWCTRTTATACPRTDCPQNHDRRLILISSEFGRVSIAHEFVTHTP